ncbi:MAG: DnaA regulatory inactivator Hda [Francisellaceae bacterium]|jgi:DnaA-homolog protein|nr:DnaA regulatory inactivator Hda [Francisellaceae bacterium]MBT6208016.1 DnaA regulatory inactivator Hda [Francisellaceae bacterium]MBT6538466.1 DnaA regulatory inactivator Hda [Francisellaceae bacterium]
MQLPLPFSLHEDFRLSNFCSLDNENLLHHIKTSLLPRHDRLLYLWGGHASGKTHLLQSIIHETQCAATHNRGIYIPFSQLDSILPANLQGLDGVDVVCLDDIEKIQGLALWQEALFGLFNSVFDNKHTVLVLSSNISSTGLDDFLPDLKSRLALCTTFKINELTDEGKIEVMQNHALKRGLTLNKVVAEFLIHRIKRNLDDLVDILDRLDAASLAYKRRLTIPFVKEVLDV